MSRSSHSPKKRLCRRHTCTVCWPDDTRVLARAPTVEEFEPGVLLCSNCYSEADRYPCECGDGPEPDHAMLDSGYELVRTTTQYGAVTVTTERWELALSERDRTMLTRFLGIELAFLPCGDEI